MAKQAEIKRESDRLRESFLNQPKVEPPVNSTGPSQTDWSDSLQVDRSSAEAPAPAVPGGVPSKPSSGVKTGGCGGGSSGSSESGGSSSGPSGTCSL